MRQSRVRIVSELSCRLWHGSQDVPVRSQKWDVWRSVFAVAGPGRDDPSSGLPGDRCNEVEVMVVVQDRRVMLNCCRGDDQIREGPTVLATRCQQSLGGQRPGHHGLGDVQPRQRLQIDPPSLVVGHTAC